MDEENKPLDFLVPIEDQMQGIIKVIGVGGGGCNAVRNMYSEGVAGVTYAVCNTDSQSLSASPVPVKILLGDSGLGAGANPELGKREAESNIDDIKKLLSDGTRMVFVTAGMGGGTGTGAAPVIAKVAKEMGLLTVGVVTIPFYFEKKRKIIKALKGVDELRKNVDAMLIINNERLCDVYIDSDISIKEAFLRADNILKDAVKGISELITIHSDGSINLDFRDVETTMRNGGGAIMAMGRANGKHRVEKAIIDALDSPLLYGNDIGNAKRILFNIYASEDHPIVVREMQEIDDFFDQLDPNIDVIWGTATDNTLDEDAKVTILATGLEDSFQSDIQMVDKDNHYEDMIPRLYKPLKNTPSDESATAIAPEPADSLEPASEEFAEPAPAEETEYARAEEIAKHAPTEETEDSPAEEITEPAPAEETEHSPADETEFAPAKEIADEEPKTPTATDMPKKPKVLEKWGAWMKNLLLEEP